MKNIARLIAGFTLFLQVGAMAISPEKVKVLHTTEVYKEVNSTQLKIDVFRNEEDPNGADKTVIVFFHGGGWAFGEPKEFYSTCERYAKMGIVAFSLDYRLSTKNGKTPHPDITMMRYCWRWMNFSGKTDYSINGNQKTCVKLIWR